MSISPLGLTKAERLWSYGEIRRLFSDGTSGFVYPIRYIVNFTDTQADEQGSVAVMFSVPKKYQKRAVKRNLLKRRMREQYRVRKSSFLDAVTGKHASLALIYSAKDVVPSKTVGNAVEKIMDLISKRSL